VDYLRTHQVDEVFCAFPSISKDAVNQLMQQADQSLARFRLVPEYYEYFQGRGRVSVEMLDNIPVISGRHEPLENPMNAAGKRLFDIVFSLIVIVCLLSWLLPILALIIKLTSRGPVFFKQKRSGRNNQAFYCLKLRSMRVNDDADRVQATQKDSRITPIGAFLRKTSLDELPQFFNVLIGNMSIVGPRPHMLKHTEDYSKIIDKFMVRHFVKPGITGWAQVTGLRGETRTPQEMQNRVEADVWYLEHWSFLLDMKIIFLTVWNICIGDKNAR
jgi:putative colanic acid biosynthesis UDP-glucose lipid carrier transferase